MNMIRVPQIAVHCVTCAEAARHRQQEEHNNSGSCGEGNTENNNQMEAKKTAVFRYTWWDKLKDKVSRWLNT